MKLVARAAAALILALLGAGNVSAHLGGGPFIIVPTDHLFPGQPFDVVAADMGPDSNVTFEIARDELVVQLQGAKAGSDGHFTASLSLPADFPTGYALLTAVGDDGAQASTWVLVGERTESTPATPPGQGPWWADPSVLVLGVFLVGAATVLTYMALRSRSKPAPLSAGRSTTSRKRRAGGRRAQV
jgi:hypothetical protein